MSGAGQSRRAWGWYKLADERAARIVAAAAVRPGELVLDLGAGTGALTGPLVQAGARVVAVELHPGRAAVLRRPSPLTTPSATTPRYRPRPAATTLATDHHAAAGHPGLWS